MLTIEQTTETVLSARLDLIAYIFSITCDYHTAEDVYQESFVKAVSRSGEFESKQHLINWFRLIARNRAIDIKRQNEGRYTGFSEETLGTLERMWDEFRPAEDDDYADALANCLRSLTPRSQAIVKMKYFENRPSREIADFIGGKIESTYQAIARIHKSLGNCIRQKLAKDQ